MTEEVKQPEEQATPQSEQSQGEQPGADLNISDLNALKSIVEVATQRGAFKAAELEAVGKTYNKLATFLSSVTKGE